MKSSGSSNNNNKTRKTRDDDIYTQHQANGGSWSPYRRRDLFIGRYLSMEGLGRFRIHITFRGIIVQHWETTTVYSFNWCNLLVVPRIIRPSTPPLTTTTSRHIAPPPPLPPKLQLLLLLLLLSAD